MKKDCSSVDGECFVSNVLQCVGICHRSVNIVKVLEGSMEGKRLDIICTLTVNDPEIQTHALTDSGATGIAFLDKYFAHHCQIPLREL